MTAATGLTAALHNLSFDSQPAPQARNPKEKIMFTQWCSAELRTWYLQSAHKQRIDFAAACLLKLKYKPAVVRIHLREWLRFVRSLEDLSLPLPTSFHQPHVQHYLKGRFPTGSASRRRGIRASIRIFLDIDADGRFARRRQAPQRTTNALFQQAVPAYLNFLHKHQGVSTKSVCKRAFQLTRFTDYLERTGIANWKEVQPSALRTFLVTQLTANKPATRLSYASTLRNFHRWAFLHGLLQRDLSAAAVAVRQYRLAGIPDLLTDDQVATLLQAVDRSTAIGKRDYAVLLLAARFGMRPSDIRQLSLDHINWRSQQIAFPQAKTASPLVLPLLPEVCDALIDYLRHGRPQTECRNVFVRHLAPQEPFGSNNNLPTIFQQALRRAGLDRRQGRKGIYLLRHTLASRLLRTGSSIKTIGDVLGHVHLDSTLVYTKVDLTNLEAVALSIEELLQ
jgi:integrase/recombinase XerD